MNSKLFFVLLLCLGGCGVKNAPIEPKGSSIPSIEDEHPEMRLKKNSLYRSRN